MSELYEVPVDPSLFEGNTEEWFAARKWEGHERFAEEIEDFKNRIREREAAGWIMKPLGITVYEKHDDLKEGEYGISVTLYGPTHPENESIRASRIDLADVPNVVK